MSGTFQSEDGDQVATVSLLQEIEQQMLHTETKDFNQLPTGKWFFERVKEEDGAFKFQDVPIKSFKQAKEAAKHTKDIWVAAITASPENAGTTWKVLNCDLEYRELAF